jgi:hypothetical protein
MSKNFRSKQFYVDNTFLPILETFDEICVREGSSRSEKIREFIERYVIVHDEGNPQLSIIKFIEEAKLRQCFFCRGHFEKLYKVEYASGLVAPTCEICLNVNREKGVFSTVKKVLGLIE